MHIDNPANTLRQFLLTIRDFPDPGKPLRQAMYVFFDTEKQNISESLLWDKIAKVMALSAKIDDTLKDYFSGEEVTAPNWRANVTTFFSSMNINASIHDHKKYFTNETLNELGLLSLLFKTKGEIGKLNNEDINDIQKQLEELKETVKQSELSNELRRDILHYINSMIRALDDYAITGIEPIISATEATMGHAYMSQPFQDVVQGTEIGSKLKTILKKTISSINTVEGVVSLGANAVTLLEHFNK
ncbi:TPA: hypothetical protein RFV45_003197 [Klebsiella pneumoniae subsp. pneumoniae]|nr:hypothetical protein [Klebsiella pneumoniae subsp. pneumoniae]